MRNRAERQGGAPGTGTRGAVQPSLSSPSSQIPRHDFGPGFAKNRPFGNRRCDIPSFSMSGSGVGHHRKEGCRLWELKHHLHLWPSCRRSTFPQVYFLHSKYFLYNSLLFPAHGKDLMTLSVEENYMPIIYILKKKNNIGKHREIDLKPLEISLHPGIAAMDFLMTILLELHTHIYTHTLRVNPRGCSCTQLRRDHLKTQYLSKHSSGIPNIKSF